MRPQWSAFFSILLLVAAALPLVSHGAADFNHITLRGGIEFDLPAQPADPELAAAFNGLSESEKQSFYQRRAFLIHKLVGALSFPRAIGGLSWVKDKIKASVNRIRGRTPDKSALEYALDGEPQTLKQRGRQALQSIVTVFVDKLWEDADYVAKANSVGFTFCFGPVFNVSLYKWGHFWGRNLSVDIGHDFQTQQGYVRFFYDKQALLRAGLSADIGVLFDFFIHFANPSDQIEMQLTHFKMPMIGSYRTGDNYRAFGMQLGVHVIEMAALAMTYYYPAISAAMVTGTRLVGTATIYSTDLRRRQLGEFRFKSKWMQRMFELEDAGCAQQLAALPDSRPFEELSQVFPGESDVVGARVGERVNPNPPTGM